MYASVNASDPIAHGVHAGEFGVGMSHGFEFGLTSLESFLFGGAGGSADFEEELFGVLSVLDHGSDFSLDF